VKTADSYTEPYARRGWLGKAAYANMRHQRLDDVTLSTQHVSYERI